jgi:tRNA threonylcarbamoyl adenosine modification protein (Sua5/YciO/YrdC/YwlC family)
MTKYILHPANPNKREIAMIVEKLQDGAIGIIPTDSVYAVSCLMTNKEGIERILKVTGKAEKKAKLSLLCKDLKAVADHTLPYDNHIFKTMKRYLPGPYTFILNANNSVTKFFKNNKKEIGIRIPDNEILTAILSSLDSPLISTSIESLEGEMTPMELIENKYENIVDFIIDGQLESVGVTTILDCTSGEVEIVREGVGVVD